MKKIMMAKYGFVRCPEEDFSDDGNRFTCYKVGTRVRVSKLVADGQVYLSARIDGSKLPYEVYSQLPHYKFLDDLNGVAVVPLTDADLEKLYQDCLAYEQEYEEAEASIAYPTLEELTSKASMVVGKRLLEISKIENRLNKHTREIIEKFSPYEWKRIQEYMKYLMADVKSFDPGTYPQQILGTARSFNFVKPETYMEESYWFKALKELFEKYGIKV